MNRRQISLRGRNVSLLEQGEGFPLLYLHGFADVHGVTDQLLPFHETLARASQFYAPAHPGCAESDDLDYLESVEDVLFHYLELLDALALERFDLIGACVGGWIAAEFAVRYPQRVRRLVLVGAAGLFVEHAPIGDVFMMAHPRRGTDYSELRQLLFQTADTPVGLNLFPDGRGEIEDELRRYKMLRFTNRFGFKPPYFYNRALRSRLYRIASPTLVVWGEADLMVPRLHGEAYAQEISGCRGLETVRDAGHSPQVEKPDTTAALVASFLAETQHA